MSDLGGLLVEAAGGNAPHAAPQVNVTAEAGREAEDLLRQLGVSPDWLRIAVHPGGHYPTQRWPVDRFADVAVALAASKHGKIVILGGPGEDELVKALCHYAAEHAVIIPPVDVASLAAVMSRCDLLLANNSGPLHLAGAVGLATVSVMGPSDPVRFHPMGRVQAVIRRENLPCSPCTRGRCGPHDCLRGIGASEVLQAAQEILDTSRARLRLGASA
jgi:ADP-heptose:LPS heptosyltransferase